MALLLSSIILFLVLTSGIAYTVMLSTSPYSIKPSKRKLMNIIAWSTIPAVLLHFLGILIAENCLGQDIDLQVLGKLFSSRLTVEQIDLTYEQIQNSLGRILVYHLTLILVGLGAGFGLQKFIRWKEWDRKYRIFRFSNKWHYIFTGECLDFPDVQGSFDDVGEKIVNIVCQIAGTAYIYSGYYFDYYLDNEGKLESLQIRQPMRRLLIDDSDEDDKYYEIPSRYIILTADSILNINMLYIKFEEAEEGLENETAI